MSDEKIKHLEFIQGVVTRMADNSFKMKGWMVTLVSAFLAFSANNPAENSRYALLALFPLFIFWGLDAYFLQQERKFRGIYGDVAGYTNNPKKIKPFSMPINLYTGGNYAYWKVFFSKTLLALYAPIAVILLVIYFFITP